MGFVKCGVFFVLVVVLMASFSVSYTDPNDVTAMNSLFVSLQYPQLIGWLAMGGDPCSDAWQGVGCVFSNITSLTLNGLNLGGTLNRDFNKFTSIIDIDISDNHIGGDIPSALPSTLRNLSFHNNQLIGGIPDVFQQMTSLTNLDLSGNNLSDQLPPSMGTLSSLSTLHLQNNRLTGTLNVLQDLPLEYLNVENNLFSGPIPEKLLGIPNFRKDGNPFNTSIIPSPPPAISPFPSLPPVAEAPQKQANGPSAPVTLKSERSRGFFASKRVIWIAVIGLVVIIIILGLCLLMSACCKGRKANEEDNERHNVGVYKSHIDEPNSKSSFERNNQEKVTKESTVKLQDQYGQDARRQEAYPKAQGEQDIDFKRMAAYSKQRMDRGINMTSMDANFMPLPPPPPSLPIGNVIANPIGHAAHEKSHSTGTLSSHFPRIFTIATLQQYSNSFSEENFVGEGTLGSVYRAELPTGELLAVKKLNSGASEQQTDEEFLQLVSSISKTQHDNIVEFVGYCNEHGQRLLVYEYCKNGTLYDALHADDEIHRKFSWNARVRLALGAARALQYLHEVCQPPIVHWNFKSSNILLDDKLVARVSDCGLAPLKSSGFATELSGRVLSAHGYGAPELELGSYTSKSDVYSFGVVMLELLTGRKSYDRSLSRGEQSLVRWAIHQLHDIDALSRMVDPSIKGACPVKSLSRFADIISRCVQWEPEFRPLMSEIVQDLLCML
ncbi:PREDICTED: protein STRUBBELIG-RECEPTOR FAMILY 3 isoform X3 [Populus euphratica]|uniref:Protein STRUBBELIG-RECEPTOR FAMILY 3 isoform X3 n=1 Tax=Populus euphratica TaxID=75702 RepID=A0AAJ6V8W3_POPEU|nr:PREDICTED: protein STRUBBELIG-RECEPTOR FAMILY 3 isoform X3 [Populus euphratica]